MPNSHWLATAGLASLVCLTSDGLLAQDYTTPPNAMPNAASLFHKEVAPGNPSTAAPFSAMSSTPGAAPSFGTPAQGTPNALELFSRSVSQPTNQPTSPIMGSQAAGTPATIPSRQPMPSNYGMPASGSTSIELLSTDATAEPRSALFTATDQDRVHEFPAGEAVGQPPSAFPSSPNVTPFANTSSFENPSATEQAPSRASTESTVPNDRWQTLPSSSPAQSGLSESGFRPTEERIADQFRAMPDSDRAYAFPSDTPASVTISEPAAAIEKDDWQSYPASPGASLPENRAPIVQGDSPRSMPMDADEFRAMDMSVSGSSLPQSLPVERGSSVFDTRGVVTQGGYETTDLSQSHRGMIQQTAAVSTQDPEPSRTMPQPPASFETDFDRASVPENTVRAATGGSMLLQPISTQPRPEAQQIATQPAFGGEWDNAGRNEWRSLGREHQPAASVASQPQGNPPAAMTPQHYGFPHQEEMPRRYERSALEGVSETGRPETPVSPFGSQHGAFRPQPDVGSR